MLLPYDVTRQNALFFLRELSVFDGLVFVAPQQPQEGIIEQPFTDKLRQKIMRQLPGDLESDLHIWIASERHGTMYSFLHAQILSDQEAQVDLLCAFRWAYNRQSNLYEHFGEIGALFLRLEQRGISHVYLPLKLDLNTRTLMGSGWAEQRPGVYYKHSGGYS